MGKKRDKIKYKPSKTADLVLAARAWAHKVNEVPVFSDHAAIQLCSKFWQTVLSSKFLTWLVVEKKLAHLNPIVESILMRARFSELEIDRAVESGFSQIVILGAGYDTFAIRRQDLVDKVTVFEVDHLGTQEEKRRRMKERGINEPENVKYCPLDLNRELLLDGLFRAKFDFNKKTIFTWLGVSYYLPMSSVTSMLKHICEIMEPGSRIVFDYVGKIEDTEEKWRQLHKDCEKFVAKKGEKWLSSFKAEKMPEFLTELGFVNTYNLIPKEVGNAYYGDVGHEYPGVFGICCTETSLRESAE